MALSKKPVVVEICRRFGPDITFLLSVCVDLKQMSDVIAAAVYVCVTSSCVYSVCVFGCSLVCLVISVRQLRLAEPPCKENISININSLLNTLLKLQFLGLYTFQNSFRIKKVTKIEYIKTIELMIF